ncbi:MAG: hypothetical protein IKE55_02635 [Kiritimatiellae bacterium]|nr:hypothetical protein [Kiritimatiellia bacterium]
MKTKKNPIPAFLALAAALAAASCPAHSAEHDGIVLENAAFRLVVGADAVPRSLVVKATGEECLSATEPPAMFTATQDRPFNNEIKLIHPNKRTVYPACSLRREGEFLVAGFPHRMYEAKVRVKVAPLYMAFELVDFICDRKTTYDYLKMDIPPVASFRVLQLSVANRRNFGDWLNAAWDDKAAVCVAGASPHVDVDHEPHAGRKSLFADLCAGIRLRGGCAALIAAPGREAFLDAMDVFERDFGLPRGVASRRGQDVRESIFHLTGFNPKTIDEMLSYATRGGFRLMTFDYSHVTKETYSWGRCGDYDWRDELPNGEADLKAMLAKVKAAGIKPGLHTLHSHIGLESRYVTPVADPRLNKTRRFTLAAPLPDGTNDIAEVAVYEPTADTVMFPACRVLQFGGELLSYESYTTEPPYRFLGVKRGVRRTRPTAHPKGEVGGILDISEFGSPNSCYIDQNTDLQDEVAAKLARIYNCGFEYVYLDGSEGVNRPFNYHLANAQYRYWRLLSPEPSFGEGAAKTHFGWHMLAGANAFDSFVPEIFKAKIVEFPCAQAPITQQDMTRVDFGWWYYYPPALDGKGGMRTIGTQPDMWEFAAAKAAAWDCAATVNMPLDRLRRHPRTDDVLETMRRWNDARRRGFVTEERKRLLRDCSREHHLLLDGNGGYELVEWEQIPVAGGKDALVRAFLYEKDARRHVVYWHIAGRSLLDLGSPHGTLHAEAMKTWSTDLPRKEVVDLFNAAKIKTDVL